MAQNYIVNSTLRYYDGKIYFAGTYIADRNFSALLWGKFDGHFLTKKVINTDKIISSSFIEDNETTIKNKGEVQNILLKNDGGCYVLLEDVFDNGVFFSNNNIIYNYDKNGKMIWKKVIEKEHRGGQLYVGFEYLHTNAFVYKDNLYVLMNETKKNAELPIGQKMEENKKWDKGIYCISYLFKDNFEKKTIVFNGDEFGDKIHDGYNVPLVEDMERNLFPAAFSVGFIGTQLYRDKEKYLINRRNSLYISIQQNKIFSIVGVDDERKISTLNFD